MLQIEIFQLQQLFNLRGFYIDSCEGCMISQAVQDTCYVRGNFHPGHPGLNPSGGNQTGQKIKAKKTQSGCQCTKDKKFPKSKPMENILLLMKSFRKE